MAGVVLFNRRSGPSATSADEMAAAFPGAEVIELDGGDVGAVVARAVEAGADYIAVAGGDGTMRAVAQVLAGGDVPMLPAPAGTRNHFAKDVGIATMEDAARAATDRRLDRVDTGRVNERVFVNNSSIGVYPKIVTSREVHQRRLRKGLAHLVAVWEQLRRGRRVDVLVEGDKYRAWLVFVGNGEYGEGLLDLADRESMTDGLLDVRVVRADEPMARLRVLGALFLGRLPTSPLVVRLRTAAVTIDVRRRRRVEVALDGEVDVLDTPLRYECRPRSLPVLRPAEHD